MVGNLLFSNEPPNSNLENVFIQEELSEEFVDPIVLGRAKWNAPPENNASILPTKKDASKEVSTIRELDPLQTSQSSSPNISMQILPPKIQPATDINRHFEGILVLRPRNLGFQKAFPFQLENSKGRRLAFVDLENVKNIDPLKLSNTRVNLLGKLEPIVEGKKDLVIRAKILRSID